MFEEIIRIPNKTRCLCVLGTMKSLLKNYQPIVEWYLQFNSNNFQAADDLEVKIYICRLTLRAVVVWMALAD